MRFEDKILLITGAGRGLGLAYARELSRLGGLVLIQDVGAGQDGLGDDPHLAEKAARELRAEGLKALALSGSISSRQDCGRLIREATSINGRLDGFIHNAGWVAYEKIEDQSEASFDRMMDIAVKAPLWLAQACWSEMKAARYGRIVLTTSDRALYPTYVQEGLAAYAAAKMAAVGLVNVLAREGAAHGIVVNAISPVAKTRMWGVEGEPDELLPSAVAPGAAFLVSEACTEGGWILRASNGQFHATRASEAEGVAYPRDLRAVRAGCVAALAAQWKDVAKAAIEPR